MPSNSLNKCRELSLAIRFLAADMVEKAKSGHPGMPLGMADVATVLYQDFLKFNPLDPTWLNRDRLILSAGHGSALLYALLYLTGYADMTIEQLQNFRQLGFKTAGHPEYGLASGIETSTGPLGQGIANAVGMAIAEKRSRAMLGEELINHKIYAICGDGCLMEGITQEAISLAGHLKLNNLIVLFDDNEISIDGSTSLVTSDDHLARFKACGWQTNAIDGHNYEEIKDAILKAQNANAPMLIACRTQIGFGAPTKAGTAAAHGAALGKNEIALMRKNFAWEHAPFEIPTALLSNWRALWNRNDPIYNAWQKTKSALTDTKLEDFQKCFAEINFELMAQKLGQFKQENLATMKDEATRASSGRCLNVLSKIIPNLIGGSADLTGSNNTKADDQKVLTCNDVSGNYIHYGVREHAMGAIMNGLALSSNIPYSGTFLTFSDYMRPAIRLSSIMKLRVVYVMTHDSIGVGEDGPTHQPVEHLASLRAIPNLNVFRPADAIETAECWELALKSVHTPSIMALSRQNLKQLRSNCAENKSAFGAYVLKDAIDPAVTIFATGSEVQIAVEVAELMQQENIAIKVVSVPCMDLFFQQNSNYQMSFSCNKSLKVAIEAGVRQGWERVIGAHGMFFGLSTFGQSAPSQKLYEHFGLTAKSITNKIKKALDQ